MRKDYIDITWPHRGSMRFGYVYGLPEEDWYYKKLTGETQIKVYADAHEFTLNPKYHSIVCCFRNNPVVILLPYYELDADFPWLNDDERNAVSLDIIETMKEQPLKGLCYVVELGNEYGDVTLDTDSKIVDNESEFESYLREVEKYINDGHSLKLPDHIPEPMLVYSNWNSTLAYDNYILLNSGSHLAKIDFDKKTWEWIGTCPVDLESTQIYNNKIWECDTNREGKLGMIWFDLSSYDYGFVAFDREIPYYTYLVVSINQYGKRIYSGFNPSTGEIETIEIDILTGHSVLTTETPNYFLESIINLN